MKRVVVIYEYFYPGFKAGGPIQSLVNLIMLLGNQIEFSVITSAYDLSEAHPYKDVKLNCWNNVTFAPGYPPVKVWYHGRRKMEVVRLYKLLRQSQSDTVFINGLFTTWSTYPLLLKRVGLLPTITTIVSARGMLQMGALRNKSVKKGLFLLVLNRIGLFKRVVWHATNEMEIKDIQLSVSKEALVIVAPNVPKLPLSQPVVLSKKQHILHLVYLSLITEKKNLLFLLKSLQFVNSEVRLSIFGPIKDEAYWSKCKSEIDKLRGNIIVTYDGVVSPPFVQAKLQQYHAMILLSQGENFGHALFESLSVGRPIVTSHFTPWLNLENRKAGWNLGISDESETARSIDYIAGIANDEYQFFCRGALSLSNEYFSGGNFFVSYSKLFNAKP